MWSRWLVIWFINGSGTGLNWIEYFYCDIIHCVIYEKFFSSNETALPCGDLSLLCVQPSLCPGEQHAVFIIPALWELLVVLQQEKCASSGSGVDNGATARQKRSNLQ